MYSCKTINKGGESFKKNIILHSKSTNYNIQIEKIFTFDQSVVTKDTNGTLESSKNLIKKYKNLKYIIYLY